LDSVTSSPTQTTTQTTTIIKSESDSITSNKSKIIYSTFIHSLPIATIDKTLILVIVFNAYKIREHLQMYQNNKNIKKDELYNTIDNLTVESEVKLAMKTLFTPEPVSSK
jgi:hypothetical protein